jgi:hypothetical protein
MSIGTKRPVCLLQATAYSLTDNPPEHKHTAYNQVAASMVPTEWHWTIIFSKTTSSV